MSEDVKKEELDNLKTTNAENTSAENSVEKAEQTESTPSEAPSKTIEEAPEKDSATTKKSTSKKSAKADHSSETEESQAEVSEITSEEPSTEVTESSNDEPSVDSSEETTVNDSVTEVAEGTDAETTDADASVETSSTVAEELTTVDPAMIPTFTGELSEVVYTFEQLQASSDDYTEEEFGELATMYENTLNRIEEKEIVTGVVISVDEKYVVVDIGFKSEGIVPVNEFSAKVLETLKPGDEVEVFLDKVEDREGQLILSRRKADILKAWEKIERAHETQEVIEGLIKRRIKGGMVVDVFGIDAFLPGSQIDVRPVRDFDAYVERTMEFQIVKLNMQAENVVVSHRSLIESDLEDQRQEILESIEKGQVLEGSVKNITDFGVFIDLGGVDGLLHITDLSWGRVDHPSEIVQLDQKTNVAVIDYDAKSKRVSLGLKQLQPHPWDDITEKYPEGQRVQGRVVSIADYGAFMELEKGVEGLIHISEMSWTQHVKHPSQLLQKGDVVECVVLTIDEDKHRISLGIKQLQEDPWENLVLRYPINQVFKGVVRNLTNFGAFVELEPGIDGLVHKNELSWSAKEINHPSEVVSKGQEIEVMVKGINTEDRRITLSHRDCLENPWEKFTDENSVGSKVKGKVTKVTKNGLYIGLEAGFDGFLNKDRFAEAVESVEESFQEEAAIEAIILSFDHGSQIVELTQNEEDLKKESSKPKKASKPSKARLSDINRAVSTPTLGEMSGLAEKLAEAQAAADEAAEIEEADEKEKKASKSKSKSSAKSTKKSEVSEEETAEEAETATEEKASEEPEAEDQADAESES